LSGYRLDVHGGNCAQPWRRRSRRVRVGHGVDREQALGVDRSSPLRRAMGDVPVLADRAWCLNPVDGHADEPWMAIECTPVYTARDRLQGGTPDMEILVELVDGLGLGVSDARAAVRAAHVLNRPTAERPPDTP